MSAKAVSPVSQLNAFDLALKNAGISQCNIVPVSSILPQGCKESKWRKITAGSITYAVTARMDGEEGMRIGAGIAWAWEQSYEFGIVAEAHGFMDQADLKQTLDRRIQEMAEIRGIRLRQTQHRIEVLHVPRNNYGCVISTLVYCL